MFFYFIKMKDKISQISEEEYKSNYNYEEFVRTIKKEDTISYKVNKFEELENKDNQKDFYFNGTLSTDVTSVSLSQTENLSQTSENILMPNDTKQKSASEYLREIDYFYGIENYFRKIYPEKFIDYKNSRNFLPKKRRDKNKIQNNINLFPKNNLEEKKNNNIQMGNNLFYYPMNGNVVFYIYNNIYFNFNNIQFMKKSEINEKKAQNKNDFNKREIEKPELNSANNNIEIKLEKNKKMDVIGDENDNIYIIEKMNYKNNKDFNKGNKISYKLEKQEKINNKKIKEKEYNYHYYNNRNNNYYNNDNYRKFNGNYEKKKRKFYFENNFHKKKYHKENYY